MPQIVSFCARRPPRGAIGGFGLRVREDEGGMGEGDGGGRGLMLDAKRGCRGVDGWGDLGEDGGFAPVRSSLTPPAPSLTYPPAPLPPLPPPRPVSAVAIGRTPSPLEEEEGEVEIAR